MNLEDSIAYRNALDAIREAPWLEGFLAQRITALIHERNLALEGKHPIQLERDKVSTTSSAQANSSIRYYRHWRCCGSNVETLGFETTTCPFCAPLNLETKIRIHDEADAFSINFGVQHFRITQEDTRELLAAMFKALGYINVDYEQVY